MRVVHVSTAHEIRQGVDMAAILIRTFEVLGMHTKCERDKVGRAEIISGSPLQDRADDMDIWRRLRIRSKLGILVLVCRFDIYSKSVFL